MVQHFSPERGEQAEQGSEFSRQLAMVETSADRLWLAFQYVTDDLSEGDCEIFEEAMLMDVRFADSVVDATRLLSTLSMTCAQWHAHHQDNGTGLQSTGLQSTGLQIAGQRSTGNLPARLVRIASASESPAFVPVRHVAPRRWTVAVVLVPLLFAAAALTQYSPSSVNRQTIAAVPLRTSPAEVASAAAAELLFSLYALTPADDAGSSGAAELFAATPSHEPGVADDPLVGESRPQESDEELLVPEWLLAAVQLDATTTLGGPPGLDLPEEESDLF